MDEANRGGAVKYVLIFVLLMGAIAACVVPYVASTKSDISVEPAVKIVGIETPMHVKVQNSHGIRTLTAVIEQDGKSYPLAKTAQPAKWFVVRGKPATHNLDLNVGKKNVPALHDGKANVTITAVSNDFRGETTSGSFEVDVMTTAPRVVADGVQHYINQGGTEMVTFSPSGSWGEAGVRVGDRTFRSYPLPDHPGQYFSLFAFSWDLPVTTPVSVYASNAGGGLAKASFWYKVFPKKFRSSTIPLESMNIERIVSQIDPQNKIKGDLVERFVYINNEMRKVNNKTLAELSLKTEQKFLWTGAFLPMVDSTVESRFADNRTYTWKGKKVDEQTHLGFDLAKVAHSPIPASNDGKVVWADDLGIYGNCVVIDHGYGLQSVYGHMSEFLVKSGEMVKKGQIIGKTGSTGLAGGDHLHFSMLVDGVQVNAVEWWDPHWVKDRILSKMGTELAASDTPAEPTAKPAARKARKKRKG
jgi:murein DD-endopeptidase MepM/ murein hydrolase activator NlpD